MTITQEQAAAAPAGVAPAARIIDGVKVYGQSPTASRRQVMGSVLGESLVVGVLASAAGVAAGIGLAIVLNPRPAPPG